MVLAEGDAVGADGRLLTAAALKVSGGIADVRRASGELKDPAALGRQAALADRVNEVFSGTVVTQGSGRAIVTATGMETEMGQVAGPLHATQEDPTRCSARSPGGPGSRHRGGRHRGHRALQSRLPARGRAPRRR